MAPFSVHGNSYESLQKGGMKSPKDDRSIGSATFRSRRRKAYKNRGETDEQLFDQHNTQSIFDNRHHDINFDDDLNSAGSSLGGYSSLGEGSKGSVRTREELRMSLIARRRRLAQMEMAMDGDGSLDYSLRLNREANNKDSGSLVSSLRDSLLDFNDSIQGSLISKRKAKSSKKKKKSKKKSSKSSNNDKDKKKKKKHKHKEKDKHHKSKKSERKHQKESGQKKRGKRRDDSGDSSSESESDEDHSKRRPQSRQQRGHAGAEEHRGSRTKSMLSSVGGGSMRRLKQLSTAADHPPAAVGGGGVLYFTCNESTGMCAYHPDVQLRKKNRFGAWKDVLRSCPKCAAAARHGPSFPSAKRRGGAVDRSSRSEIIGRGAGPRGGGGLDGSDRSGTVSGGRGPRGGSLERIKTAPSREGNRKRPPDRGPRPSQRQRGGEARGGPQPHRRTSGPAKPGPPQTRQRGESTSRARLATGPVKPGPSQHSQKSMSTSRSRTGNGGRHPQHQQQQQQQHQQYRDMRQRQAPPARTMQPRRTSYKDPPGAAKNSAARSKGSSRTEGLVRSSSSLGRANGPAQADGDYGLVRSKSDRSSFRPPPSAGTNGGEGRVGREKMVSNEPSSGSRSVSTQRTIMDVVDFDPPNPSLANQGQQRPTLARGGSSVGRSTRPQKEEYDLKPRANYERMCTNITHDDSSQAIGSESEFALFQGNGGKAYNEEGMFSFFRDTSMHKEDSAPNPIEKKMAASESCLLGGRNLESLPAPRFGQFRDEKSLERNGSIVNGGIQMNKAKSFHGHPPHSSAPAISIEELRKFVEAESARFDHTRNNLGDLERHLMEQVARLSIGSGDEDITGDGGYLEDAKFSVLRQVVKSYMNKEQPKDYAEGDVGRPDRPERDSGERREAEASPPRRERPRAYALGDEGRRRDMIKDDDKDVALMRIASLQPDDPAFIRRTTGKWTYAKVKHVGSDSIVFVVSPNGSSKTYNLKYWVSHIRTVKAPAPRGAATREEGDPSGRWDAFARQSSNTRFSTKELRVEELD